MHWFYTKIQTVKYIKLLLDYILDECRKTKVVSALKPGKFQKTPCKLQTRTDNHLYESQKQYNSKQTHYTYSSNQSCTVPCPPKGKKNYCRQPQQHNKYHRKFLIYQNHSYRQCHKLFHRFCFHRYQHSATETDLNLKTPPAIYSRIINFSFHRTLSLNDTEIEIHTHLPQRSFF